MVIVSESATALKGFVAKTGLKSLAQAMLVRMILAFIAHRGRMSCSQAAGAVSSDAVHRGELTRFLARPRWQKHDFNEPLRAALLAKESRRGSFLFVVDATLVSQSGKNTQNTFSTGNRQRRPKQRRRYNKKKVTLKKCHSFTFGLLITPSGIRIPYQIPHYTQEHCQQHNLAHRTTAEAAADMIGALPLPKDASVIVLGDAAYESAVVEAACSARGYTWILPANSERVYERTDHQQTSGQQPHGQRSKLRSRLKDWTSLSLQKIRLRASTGNYALQRRLSKHRVGPKQKPRDYYAHQETREVRRVGRVKLVFSTTKPNLETATPDDVKILLTNALRLSAREVIELYALRWQIELFFKELKSTLGFDHYRFANFAAVRAWAEIAIAVVLFLEDQRARRLSDRRLKKERKAWWHAQRLHGLCAAFRQECAGQELNYLAKRLKTKSGIAKLKRLLNNATPPEFRTTT